MRAHSPLKDSAAYPRYPDHGSWKNAKTPAMLTLLTGTRVSELSHPPYPLPIQCFSITPPPSRPCQCLSITLPLPVPIPPPLYLCLPLYQLKRANLMAGPHWTRLANKGRGGVGGDPGGGGPGREGGHPWGEASTSRRYHRTCVWA
jgi:hypothetical protein